MSASASASAADESFFIPPTSPSTTRSSRPHSPPPPPPLPPQPKSFFVRALYDYVPTDVSSLGFSRGDLIEVLTQLPSGWWDGLVGNNVRGWFPSNYVEIISEDEAERELLATAQADADADADADAYDDSDDAQPLPRSHDAETSFIDGWDDDVSRNDGADDARGHALQALTARDQAAPSSDPLAALASLANETDAVGSSENIFEQLAEAARSDAAAAADDDDDERSTMSSSRAGPGTRPRAGTAASTMSSRAAPTVRTSVASSAGGRKGIADYWEPKVTESGQIFYYNTRTGEHARELPLGPTDSYDDDPSAVLFGAVASSSLANRSRMPPDDNESEPPFGSTPRPSNPASAAMASRSRSGSASMASSAAMGQRPLIGPRHSSATQPGAAAATAGGRSGPVYVSESSLTSTSASGSIRRQQMASPPMATSAAPGARKPFHATQGSIAVSQASDIYEELRDGTSGRSTPSTTANGAAAAGATAASVPFVRRPSAISLASQQSADSDADGGASRRAANRMYATARQGSTDSLGAFRSPPDGHPKSPSSSKRFFPSTAPGGLDGRRRRAGTTGALTPPALVLKAERDATKLQTAMNPPSPTTVGELIDRAKGTVERLVQTTVVASGAVNSEAVSASADGSTRLPHNAADLAPVEAELEQNAAAVVQAVRNLLFASGTLSIPASELAALAALAGSPRPSRALSVNGLQQLERGQDGSSSFSSSSATGLGTYGGFTIRSAAAAAASTASPPASDQLGAPTAPPPSLQTLARRMTAQLSKLVLSSRAAGNQLSVSAPLSPNPQAQVASSNGSVASYAANGSAASTASWKQDKDRVKEDALELDRAIDAFAAEVERVRSSAAIAAAAAGGSALSPSSPIGPVSAGDSTAQWMRRVHGVLRSANGTAGVGFPVYGAGSAGAWKGNGFVTRDRSSSSSSSRVVISRDQKEKDVLRTYGLHELSRKLDRQTVQVDLKEASIEAERHIFALVGAVRLCEGDAESASRADTPVAGTNVSSSADKKPYAGPAALPPSLAPRIFAQARMTLSEVHALLSLVEEIDIASSIDLDGLDEGSTEGIRPDVIQAYKYSVGRARQLVRAVEANKQAVYDASAGMLLHVQSASDNFHSSSSSSSFSPLAALLKDCFDASAASAALTAALNELFDISTKQVIAIDHGVPGLVGARTKPVWAYQEEAEAAAAAAGTKNQAPPIAPFPSRARAPSQASQESWARGSRPGTARGVDEEDTGAEMEETQDEFDDDVMFLGPGIAVPNGPPRNRDGAGGGAKEKGGGAVGASASSSQLTRPRSQSGAAASTHSGSSAVTSTAPTFDSSTLPVNDNKPSSGLSKFLGRAAGASSSSSVSSPAASTSVPAGPGASSSANGSKEALGRLERSDSEEDSSMHSPGRSNKIRKFFGDEAPQQAAVKMETNRQVDNTPWYLQPDYAPSDIVMNLDGNVKGATLEALVERLTMHDSLDTAFNNTFLLTYRSFTTTDDLFDLLEARFDIKPPEAMTDAEAEDWALRKQTPIRLRVFNIIKSWLESYFYDGEDDPTLERIRAFAMNKMAPAPSMSLSSNQLVRLIERRQGIGESMVRKMVLPTSAPAPVLPKNLRKIKFLDIDPLEMARQLTIMESRVYNKIKPVECLHKSWSKPDAAYESPNVKEMINISNKLTGWVAEAILVQEDLRRRAAWIKQFIHIADRCRTLNNFSSMVAIVSALNTAPIHRLKRTWDAVNQRGMAVFEVLNKLMQSTRNFADYRELLHAVNPPCVPFLGVYLTDLTFIEDGNPDRLKVDERLINFSKRQKTSEIIREIVTYQSTPYNLTPVPGIQKFIEDNLVESRQDADLYEQSLLLEPREREDEKIARLLQESGFL